MLVANNDLCGADTTYFTIDVWTNELIELKSEIHIYPNPASDLIHVHHEGGDLIQIRLMDAAGRILINFSHSIAHHILMSPR